MNRLWSPRLREVRNLGKTTVFALTSLKTEMASAEDALAEPKILVT